MKKLLLIILFSISLSLSVYSYPIDSTQDVYINVKDFGAKGDGISDDSQAIIDACNKAYKTNKIALFPKGTYLISQKLSFPFDNGRVFALQGQEGATLISTADFTGNMIESGMQYNFFARDLNFIHQGPSGKIIKALYLVVENCSFKGNDNLIEFAGSNCKILNSSFETENEEAFAIEYIRQEGQISINDYITDNTIEGKGQGIRIGGNSTDGRPEGLKISGNSFSCLGDYQVQVETILHLDISNNSFKNSKEAAILVKANKLGVHGLFVMNNDIESRGSGLLVSDESNAIASIHLVDNYIHNVDYGLKMAKAVSDVHVNKNLFSKIKNRAIHIEKAIEIYISDNLINDKSPSFYIQGEEGINYVIENNTYQKKAKIDIKGYQGKKAFNMGVFLILPLFLSLRRKEAKDD